MFYINVDISKIMPDGDPNKKTILENFPVRRANHNYGDRKIGNIKSQEIGEYDQTNTEAWFAQAESMFTMRGIT